MAKNRSKSHRRKTFLLRSFLLCQIYFIQQKNITFTSNLNIEFRKKLVRFMFEAYIVWLKETDIKKIGVEIFGELQNVELEENGEEKMAKESN